MAVSIKKYKSKDKGSFYVVRFGKSGSVVAKTKREATKVANALRKLAKK